MGNLAAEIAQANETQIEVLLKAVLHRYAELFPDWEVSTISLEKSSDPKEQLDKIIAVPENMKTSP